MEINFRLNEYSIHFNISQFSLPKLMSALFAVMQKIFTPVNIYPISITLDRNFTVNISNCKYKAKMLHNK